MMLTCVSRNHLRLLQSYRSSSSSLYITRHFSRFYGLLSSSRVEDVDTNVSSLSSALFNNFEFSPSRVTTSNISTSNNSNTIHGFQYETCSVINTRSDGDIDKCNSESIQNQRLYYCDGRWMPSVTTILDATSFKLPLQRWKSNQITELGLEGFLEKQKRTLDTGSAIHARIEQHLAPERVDVEICKPYSDMSLVDAFWESVQPVLHRITDVRGIESSVYHPYLDYAGTIDCIARLDGELMIIDWKTAYSNKSVKKNLFDQPIQGMAYAGAVNVDPRYDFEVKGCAIIPMYADNKPADVHKFHIESDGARLWANWLKKLERFYNLGHDNAAFELNKNISV